MVVVGRGPVQTNVTAEELEKIGVPEDMREAVRKEEIEGSKSCKREGEERGRRRI